MAIQPFLHINKKVSLDVKKKKTKILIHVNSLLIFFKKWNMCNQTVELKHIISCEFNNAYNY